MQVLSIVHQADAGPGVFAPVLAAGGHEVEEWRPDRRASPRRSPAAYDATLAFGGAMNVDEEGEHPWLGAEKELLAELVALGAPLLGVCLGAQLLAEAAGGAARAAASPEIGWREVAIGAGAAEDPLLAGLAPRFSAFEWHSYAIDPPPGGACLARSDRCLQAFRVGEHAWGLQFHAEVTEEIVAGWVEKDGEAGELRAAGVDPAALLAATRRRIADSNRLGATICNRFLALAAGASLPAV